MLLVQRASQRNLRGFLFIPTLVIFFSCSTTSPVEPARLQTAQETLSSFSSVEFTEPEWLPFADGVGFLHGKAADPAIEFWALRIDLAAPNISVVVSGKDGNADETLSMKVSSFVRGNNLIAGINALPFDVSSARENLPIKNIGIVISGGELISSAVPRYDALVFYKDGSAAIVSQSTLSSIENIENAAGGFFQILADGEPAQRTLDRGERHPRSAAGLSVDGSVLYLLVIDGRRSGSVGGTEKETALLLHSLGAWNGINFDGGGSTALALRYPDGKTRTVNTPIHGGVPGRERAVAGCIGISLSTER